MIVGDGQAACLRYLGRHMTLLRTLVAVLALGGGLGTGCYSEQLPPGTYRYACDADSDCNDNEMCRAGVCERTCTQVTATEDCPQADGFVACFNGACSSTCEIGAGRCPSSQECLDFGIDVGGGGGFGGGSTAAVGICGTLCDETNDICPQGEVCLPSFGTCVVDCSAGQACPTGFACTFGICAPADSEADDDGQSTGAAGNDDGSSGDGSSGAVEPTDPAQGQR